MSDRPIRAALCALSALVALLAPPAVARGGEAEERAEVEVVVTAVSGRSAYVDAGRLAGVEVGDPVRLLPLGRHAVEGTVRAVSRSSARVELDGALDGVEIGIPGVIVVPAERLRPPPEPAREPEDEGVHPTEEPGWVPEPAPEPVDEPLQATPLQGAPEHPPWTHPPEEWSEEMPLLAPVQGLEPEERDPRFHGRFYQRVRQTWDDSSGEREYTSSRTGLDLEWENPFGRGGTLELDTDLIWQLSREGGASEDDLYFRPDRLSYRVGGLRGQPDRWQVGRFLHHEFPELGLIDGVEYGRRTSGGDRFGASVGVLPEPRNGLETGKNLQVSGFYRWVSGEDEDLALGVAAQKTWHEGEADRDLLIATADWRPSLRTSVHATAWIDQYDSGDDPKSSGLELTQAVLSATRSFSNGSGVSLFANQVRWPVLLRDEFDPVTLATLADGEVTRVGLNAWHPLTKRIRLNARVDQWEDEDDSGGGGELRATFRDVLGDDGDLSLAVFTNEGSFSTGTGGRLGLSKRLDDSWLRFDWETVDYQQEDFNGEQESLLHHLLRASWDTELWDEWDLSLYGEARLGDEQDSRGVGFSLVRRF